jgi:hypothetical protein
MDGSTYDMPITPISNAMRRAMSTATVTVVVTVAAF